MDQDSINSFVLDSFITCYRYLKKIQRKKQKWEKPEHSAVLDAFWGLISFLGICRTAISMHPKDEHGKKGNSKNSDNSFSHNQPY